MSEAGQELIKVGCTNCGSKYSLPQERLKGRVLKIRCKSCDTIFEVRDRGPQSISSRGQRRWFAVINRERVGPMTAQQVRDRFAQGEITMRTYLWRQGMEKWERLHRVAEFDDLAQEAALTRPPVTETRAAKGRADTLRLVRLGTSRPEADGGGPVKWAQAATRAANLSGMAELSELERKAETHASGAGAEPAGVDDGLDDDTEVPTQVRRIELPAAATSGLLSEPEEQTTRRAVHVDAADEGPGRDDWDDGPPDALDDVRQEETTRKTSLAALARAEDDSGEYEAEATTVDQLRREGDAAGDELASFARNLEAISSAPQPSSDLADTLETERPAGPRKTGPEIAIEPPARPGAVGRRLAQERGQNSVLFSLDHLKADAARDLSRAPTAEPARIKARAVEARDEPTPVAEELYVPLVEPAARKGGGLRFFIGMLVGGALIFGVLFAINPHGMKRLLGVAGDDPAAGLALRGDEPTAVKGDATALAAAASRRDAGQPARATPRPDVGAAAVVPDAAAGRDSAQPVRDAAPAAPDLAKKPASKRPKPTVARADRPAARPASAPARRRPRRVKPRRRKRVEPAVTVVETKEPEAKRPKPEAGEEGADSSEKGAAPPADKPPAEPAGVKAAAQGSEKGPKKLPPDKTAPKTPVTKTDAPKGEGVPATISREQVSAGLVRIRAAIKACASEGGLLTIEVTVAGKSGRATDVRVLGALVEDEVRSCVAKVVKQRARFPTFSQPHVTAKVPLVLR